MTKEQENAMVEAHKIGRVMAHRLDDGLAVDKLERGFVTQDERDAFRAGFVAEKRRIAKR